MVAEIRYWDVFPKSIRAFRTAEGEEDITFQLVLCGDPRGVMFESDDEMVAEANGSSVTVGMKVGYATIRVYEPAFPENVRKVAVQVLPIVGAGIQSIGAENQPGEDTGRYASEGHVHQGLTQFGTNIQSVGAVNSPGTADAAARADHVHQGPVPGGNIQQGGAANAAGTSASLAREDHVHKIVWLEYQGP
jgi:hypothetical protein